MDDRAMSHPAHASSGPWWTPGGEPGHRLFLDIGELELEFGGRLPAVRLAYETWGTLNAAGDNAILVEHALTGDSHVVGPAGPGHPSPGWWDGLIGPGHPIDTRQWFVVAANVVGGCRGSTGPSTVAADGRPWGSRFPFVSIRDQVAAEVALSDALGVRQWAMVIGGSMGGMRVLEWAVGQPDRVDQAMVLATTAAATADQTAWAQPQLLAIRHDPDFAGGDYYEAGAGPVTGLGIARRIAHTTYRSSLELDVRFGRQAQEGELPLGGGGRYAVESYLDHHALKLGRRFDANSYLVLTEAMNSHDVGRGRGGVAAALSRIRGHVTVAGVDSDRLYPLRESQQIAQLVPSARFVTIHSDHGHDGFLIEVGQVGRIVGEALADHIRGGPRAGSRIR